MNFLKLLYNKDNGYKKITIFLLLLFIYWIVLFAVGILKPKSHIEVDNLAAQLDLVVHIGIILYTFKIYNKSNLIDRAILLWFVFVAISTFTNDVLFYFFYTRMFIASLPFVVDYVSFAIWNISLIVLLFNFLIKKILNGNSFFKVGAVLILMNLAMLYLFLASTHFPFHHFSWKGLSQIFAALCHFIIFSFAILCLIYAEKKGVSILLSGIIIATSGDLLVIYSIASETSILLFLGQLFWTLGLLFMLCGLIIIETTGNHYISDWFKKKAAIKNGLAFWSFNVSIVGFVLFFIIAHIFSILNEKIFLGLPLFVMMYSIITVNLSILMGRKFEVPFKKIEDNIKKLMLYGNKVKLDDHFLNEEFIFLQGFIVEAFEFKEEKDKAKKELGELAAQVAHDIRSPLTAMNVCLQKLPEIPERERIILRNASNRINDIATKLLNEYKNKETTDGLGLHSPLQTLLVEPIIEVMLSEKRLSFEGKPIILEAKITEEAYFVFAKVEPKEIKRVLSNLLNNASEAFSASGNITVLLDADKKNVYIQVVDNGCGIPTDKLATIFEAKKTTKESGSGIGLAHAKEAIQKMDGEIAISSKLNEGTIVSIRIPRANAPSWFISNISIEPNCQIVVLDDDESIHGAWDTRLKEFLPNSNILHFRRGQDFINWYLENKNVFMLVLSDYELLGELKTGLDILEELNIGHHGVLITSHYEKSEIIERCIAANIRLLPKNLVTHIPIILKEENNSRASDISKKRFDYILIDDDKLITDMWLMQAETFDKKLVVFNSVLEAEKQILEYDTNIIIYIDSNLEDGKKGEDYAKKLYDEHGFHTIYLATGHSPNQFKPMYWIKAIIGKDKLF